MSPIHRHALRTVSAALLALGLAYLLELETPYSAATTVLIVAHPMHGMILSKSIYRLGGTLIGAFMALLLMGLFAQSPEMFMLGLSLWMGVCTMASTLLRGFRSYGAVLAGYTVVMITMPGVDTPDQIFDLAVSRVSVVALGIACSALVASLTTGRKAEETLDAKLRGTLRKLAAYARQSLEGATYQSLSIQRRTLAGEISGLDAMVEFAAIESAVGMADLEDTLRGAAMAMFSVLTAAASAHGALERLDEAERPQALQAEFLELLARLEVMATLDDLRVCRAELAELARKLEAAILADDLHVMTAIDRLDELADELGYSLDGALTLAGVAASESTLPVRKTRIWRHRDFSWGAINGLRACITVWAAGALWFMTSWTSGWAMVSMVVPNIGLLAMRDRPVSDAGSFVWGTMLASLVGLFYLAIVLPNISGFPLLALVLAVPLLLGVIYSMKPKTAFIGVGFYVFFITLLAPTNPMSYSPEFFLNNALATVGGAALTAVAHRLILPIDPRRHVRALVRAIQSDLRALLLGSVSSPEAWEGRMHERLIQLGVRMAAAGVRQDGLLRGGFASLRLGREMLRVRNLLAQDQVALDHCAPVREALRKIGSEPHAALNACRDAAQSLSELAATRSSEESRAPMRAAASLTEIAVLLGRHRRFFQRIPA